MWLFGECGGVDEVPGDGIEGVQADGDEKAIGERAPADARSAWGGRFRVWMGGHRKVSAGLIARLGTYGEIECFVSRRITIGWSMWEQPEASLSLRIPRYASFARDSG